MMGTTYSSQDTYLNRLDARTKLILLVAVFTLVLIFSHPLYIVALLALVMVAWGSARIPFGAIKTIMQYFLVLAIIIFVFQVFFYQGTTNLFKISGPMPVIGFNGYITLEGVMFGVAMVMRLVVIMVVAPLLVMTTPLPEMMIAFVKFKIPYRFAFVMTTAMSMLPSIQNRAFLIQQAQLCRGVNDFEGGNLYAKLRVMSAMLVPLILGTFRDSQVLDVAMSSRAFGAPAKRTFLLESHFESMDYVMLAFAAILFVGGITLRVMNFGIV
jgi:energy-coupling factor transport system permease protein